MLATLGLGACAEVASLPPAAPPTPAPPPEVEAKLQLAPASFAELPGWGEDGQAAAVSAFLRSCTRFRPQPPDRMLDNGGAARDISVTGFAGRIGDWLPACDAAERLPAGNDAAARTFFETWFIPWRASNNGRAEGLITGYYEAELKGSLVRKGPYQYPIHAPPSDLINVDMGSFKPEWKGQQLQGRVEGGRLLPYHSRGEIIKGALEGKARPLVWVDDRVDAFVLHIQGSGRVNLDDGRVLRLGFAGRNGHAYRSIGRELIDRGELPSHGASMPAIRAWIDANPGKVDDLLGVNPSYIFFRVLEGEGPIGGQGVPLTPGRSLAVDHRFVPYGVPVWLDTSWPLDERRPLRRLMVAQDTGGAITGPVRGDFFWGYGREAMEQAGRMKQTGRYWLLLPRAAAGWSVRSAR